MKSFKKIFLMLTSFAMVVGTLLIGGGIKKTEQVEAAGQTTETTIDVVGKNSSGKIGALNEWKITGNVSSKSGSSYIGLYGGATITNDSPIFIDTTRKIEVYCSARKYGGPSATQATTTFKLRDKDKNEISSCTITPDSTSVAERGPVYFTGIEGANYGTSICCYFEVVSSSNSKDGVFCGIGSISLKYYPGYEAYRVTFDSNGGSSVDSITNIEPGSIISAPTAPTRNDENGSRYTFAGWYKDEALKNLWDFSTDKVSSDITLYAKWTEKKVTIAESFVASKISSNLKFRYMDASVPNCSVSVTVENMGINTDGYTTTFTKELSYSKGTENVKTNFEAHGVYKNTNGIQMNTGKGTYIKNLTAFGNSIKKIEMTWHESGKNSPTIYFSNEEITKDNKNNFSANSVKMSNSEKTQTIVVAEKFNNEDFKYFYFDGTTVTGVCYLKELKIVLSEASTNYHSFSQMAMQFKYDFDFSAYSEGTDYSEAGILMVKGETNTDNFTGEKATTTALPTTNAKALSQDDFTSATFKVALTDISSENYDTKILAVGYVLVNGTYYYNTPKFTSVKDMMNAYSKDEESSITYSDGTVVMVKDLANAFLG